MRARPRAFRELTGTTLALDVCGVFHRLVRLPYPLLLDSAVPSPSATPQHTTADHRLTAAQSHAPLARYSFATASPKLVLTATGRLITVADSSTGTIVREEGRALDVVRRIIETEKHAPISNPTAERNTGSADTIQHAVPDEPAALPPFVGGWAGYVGYEYGGVLERIPRAEDKGISTDGSLSPTEDAHSTIPDVILGQYTWVIAWDHVTGQSWIVGDDDDAVQHAYDLVFAPLDTTRLSPTSERNAPTGHGGSDTDATDATDADIAEISSDALPHFDSSMSRSAYESAVETVRRYIAAGDVFQVNLSQQFRARVDEDPWTFYQRLRAINPAPFSAYFDVGTATIVSISPERFLHLDRSGTIETRPIKGTRPRSDNPHDDAKAQDALRASAKDAAEHVMIVDVLRNDIARVSTFGSVTVPELMTLESHPTVHHLVSTVRGMKRPDADAIDLLHACFPGGSITGAPKVRAMEIIAELEPVNRGVYCGAIGYLSASGAMDTSIAIRTCVLTPQADYYHCTFSAGGGIVFDSVPAEEYEESLDKARAVMQAILAHPTTGKMPARETPVPDDPTSLHPGKAGTVAR